MPDLQVTVTEVIPEFAKLLKKMDFRSTFPNTLAALNILAIEYTETWRRMSQGAPIPGTSKRINSRGDYTRSINYDISSDERKIVFSDANKPYTSWIEEGHGEIDLKPGLLAGPKARAGKKGPYNIVSFRHGVPGTDKENNAPMPMNIYNVIKSETNKLDSKRTREINKMKNEGTSGWLQGWTPKRGTSKIIETYEAPNAKGESTLRRTYDWGYRLPAHLGGTPETKQTSKGEYTWKSGKHAEMVRMQTSTSRAKNSNYITFRVVSYRSDPASWIVPEREGIAIRAGVLEQMAEKTKEILAAAMREDLIS